MVGRLAHAAPFVKALERIGAPVDKGLRSARLPVESADADLVVPVHCIWGFAEFMARREGIEDLGLEASFEIEETFIAQSLMARVQSAPNLLGGLRQFSNHCHTESNRTAAGLTQHKDTVRFWHLGAFDDHPGLTVMEVYFVMAQLALVRLFLGPRWQPPVIGLQRPRGEPSSKGALPRHPLSDWPAVTLHPVSAHPAELPCPQRVGAGAGPSRSGTKRAAKGIHRLTCKSAQVLHSGWEPDDPICRRVDGTQQENPATAAP